MKKYCRRKEKEGRIIPLITGNAKTLCEICKGRHGDKGHGKYQECLQPVIYVVQDKIGIKNKHKRYYGCPYII